VTTLTSGRAAKLSFSIEIPYNCELWENG
jgi:hypothetical protein